MANTVIGKVVSAKGQKSITIRVDTRVSHPIYKKQYTRSNKFYAHDEKSEAALGDTVEIMSVRPISKTKNWNLVRVVTKARILGGEE